MQEPAPLTTATGSEAGFGCAPGPPGRQPDADGKRRAQTLDERNACKRRALAARRQRQALRGETPRETAVDCRGGALTDGRVGDMGPPPAALLDEPGGQGAAAPPLRTGGALVACPDGHGGLPLFCEPMPHTHVCGMCGKTGTCSSLASKHAPQPGKPRSVRMMGHECRAADKYVLFKVSADLVPSLQTQFERNCEAAREHRARLEAPQEGGASFQSGLAPMPHTHKCGQCGKTGTCKWLASARPSPSAWGAPRPVCMSTHRCAVTGKSVHLRVTADMMPGMELQLELNRQAARARRALLESRSA